MKIDSKFDKPLEISNNFLDTWRFIKSSYDGRYLILLSILYFSWAMYMMFFSDISLESWFGAVLFYPILLFVVYIRQRLGTSYDDKTAAFFSFISLTVLSVAPLYYVYWR